ncbi:WbqC family protein [Aureitalea sp. L0-47]|uniref:WbqC family protein n=1 Tax=Aureitalea sp. L0-47 TaxID=2816962 RepID=UPI002AA2B222|nr:WbqC family protein [Aureitalea sp. L0-47]
MHPSYFPSIAHMVSIAIAEEVIFEVEDNYQKQTYRNRSHIAHTNGRLLLNVPIKHSKDGRRQKTKDVFVENSFPWQSQHWKSLQTAYRTSPYFEFYEDDLEPLFNKPVEKLMDHNLEIFSVISELIGLDVHTSQTDQYEVNTNYFDLRSLVVSKSEKEQSFSSYTQVFQANHGFLPNLSILDLLFNEGPNTLDYLEEQKLVL